MTRPYFLNGIQAVAETHLEFEGTLTEETSLSETLRLDSIRLLTLVAELENHFQICLEDGDECGLDTVGGLIDVLRLRSA